MNGFPSLGMTRLRSLLLAVALSTGGAIGAGQLGVGAVSQAFADDAVQQVDIAHIGAAEIAMLNDELYKVSRGFENDFADKTRRPALAAKLYRLEQLSMAMLASGEQSMMMYGKSKRSELRGQLRAIFGRVTQLNESFFLRALGEYHAAEGEPARRLGGVRVDLFGPIDRKNPDNPDIDAAYESAVAEGAKIGATVETFSKGFVDGLGNNELSEWVARDDGTIAISKNGAKHLHLGKGKAARSAGGLKVLKTPNGDVQMVLIMPNSGSYKPSIASIEIVRQQLLDMGFAADQIETPGYLVGDTAIYSVGLMSVGIDRKVAKADAKALEQATILELEAKLQPMQTRHLTYLSTRAKALRSQQRQRARLEGAVLEPSAGSPHVKVRKPGKTVAKPRGKR